MNIENITQQHVLEAVAKIERDQIELEPSTKFDVLINGKSYPPKEVMRYANLLANGTKDWPYSGGEPTNKYLRQFGFEILEKISVNTEPSNQVKLTGNVWKMGCNWGSKKPSFYGVIKEKSIVIGTHDKMYRPGDLILIAEGQTVKGLGKVLVAPSPVTENPDFKSWFAEYEIEYNSGINFARAEWLKLEGDEIFKYKTQIGICRVQDYETKNLAINIWNNHFGTPINKSMLIMNNQTDLFINTILYGPPGTGKTFELNKYKEEYFTDRGITKSASDVLREKVANYPFWKILAAVMGVMDRPISVTELLSNPLIKSKINPVAKIPRNTIWRILQSYADDLSTEMDAKYKGPIQLFHKNEESRWSIMSGKQQELADIIDQELLDIAANPVVQPIQNSASRIRYNFITFHQKYSYEDFIEGIKPVLGDSNEEEQTGELQFELKRGVFYTSCLEALRLVGYESFKECYNDNPSTRREKFKMAQNDGTKQFALFIDEINRANISAVFGELITLLEEDKRIGAENEMWVELPYSNDKFCVPGNLYVLGTMNTADRSIALLDIALRRRFEFKALYPLYTETEWWSPLLLKLNQAIYEWKKNPDFFIGHAFFINRPEHEKTKILNSKIIPLLYEYCQNNAETVKSILVKAGVQIKQTTINENFQIFAE